MAEGGKISFFGESRVYYSTQLVADSAPGSNVLSVKHGVDWKEGDVVLIASSSPDQYETEE